MQTAAARALADFEAHRGAPSRKEFALAVKDAPWAAVTFRLYGLGGSPDIATAKAIMRETSVAALERIAGVA